MRSCSRNRSSAADIPPRMLPSLMSKLVSSYIPEAYSLHSRRSQMEATASRKVFRSCWARGGRIPRPDNKVFWNLRRIAHFLERRVNDGGGDGDGLANIGMR